MTIALSSIAQGIGWAVLLFLSYGIAVHDLKHLKIRNGDVLKVLLVGLTLTVLTYINGYLAGTVYLLSHLAQAALYSVPFLILYKFNSMGAGDVKLCAALFFALPGEMGTLFLFSLPVFMALSGLFLTLPGARGLKRWNSLGTRRAGSAPLGPAICLAVLSSGLLAALLPSVPGI